MTQTGKCDTCRLRKVKCDEKHPKCSQCSRKDRPCIYTYGKLSAVVAEDPNEYTNHGRSKTTPIVYPIILPKDPPVTEEDSKLRLTMERKAGNGAGMFLAFEPATTKKSNALSNKCTAVRKKPINKPPTPNSQSLGSKTCLRRKTPRSQCTDLSRLSAYLTTISPTLESPEYTLTARYIHLFSSSSLATNPFSILGSWITSIPSRIGHDPTLYLAVEYAVNAFFKFVDPSWERCRVAQQSKAKGLKSLAMALAGEEASGKERGEVRWDLMLATKLHYGAECLMGITTCYHTIHAKGLTEMLKLGFAEGMDAQHYWDLVDNTYFDEVSESLLAGRVSMYDNPTYLTLTSPLVIATCDPPPSSSNTASKIIMHSFIQLPRLACLVRHAVANPQDEEILSAALALGGELWTLDPSTSISSVMQTNTSIVNSPPCSSVADIIPTSLQFDSIQDVMLLARYWTLQNSLCGILETMYKNFPDRYAAAVLPSIDMVRQVDADAAVKIAQSVPYASSISPNLPLVQMRLLLPVGTSMGVWCRAVRRLEGKMGAGESALVLSFEEELELDNARKMQNWVAEQGNKVHVAWGVDPAPIEIMQVAIGIMAGEEIPMWMPRRVRFEEVGDEMVMKVEFEN